MRNKQDITVLLRIRRNVQIGHFHAHCRDVARYVSTMGRIRPKIT
jgi:hypothetical protein